MDRILEGRDLHHEPSPLSGSTPADQQETSATDDDALTVWQDFNLLTFDGGGIRGFWSLLVISQLMELVAIMEMSHPDGKAAHSFHPLPYPEEVSQVPRTEAEVRDRRNYSKAEKVEGLDRTRRYLPCHYFDYMGGTSTGALIAIMLGRLRMPVMDCLQEYEYLGHKIFGRPRFWTMVLTKKAKYRTEDIEGAFKDVVRRRHEKNDSAINIPKYPSTRGMCNTFVTTLASKLTGTDRYQSRPFPLRSYVFEPRSMNGPPPSRTKSKRTIYGNADAANWSYTGQSQRTATTTKEEGAHNIEIWQAARAATAAMKYFQRLSLGDGEMSFEDAGPRVPNPTDLGLREIRDHHGNDAVGMVVSVGTARAEKIKNTIAGDEFIMGAAQRIVDMSTDPEPMHLMVRDKLRKKGTQYWRFNPDKEKHRLDIVLDKIEPRGGKTPGSRTLELMRKKFNDWYESDPAVEQMFRNCASEMVGRRRERAKNAAKWERYVNGSHYRCPVDICPDKHRKFTTFDRLKEHLDVGQPGEAHHASRIPDLTAHNKGAWEYQRPEKKQWA